MAVPSDSPIKFPVKNTPAPALTLRRRLSASRSPFEVSDASAAARESIKSFVSSTRTPWGEPKALSGDRVGELEKSLRQLETLLTERERTVAEAEARLNERERDLAEVEALILAREKLVELARKQKPAVAAAGVSKEEQAALEQLRTELERQETALKEGKQALREREQFLEESETKLFAKVQAQQEKEIELEQREEELRAKALRLREKEATLDPAVAAALQAEKAAAKKFDEFNE